MNRENPEQPAAEEQPARPATPARKWRESGAQKKQRLRRVSPLAEQTPVGRGRRAPAGVRRDEQG